MFSVGTKENLPKTEGYLHISVNFLHADNLITLWALAKPRKHIWYSFPDVFDSTISFFFILRQSVALWDIGVSFSSAFISLWFLMYLQFYCCANVILKFSQAESAAHEAFNNNMVLQPYSSHTHTEVVPSTKVKDCKAAKPQEGFLH